MEPLIDPVCLRAVPADAEITHTFHGTRLAFCSAQCRDAFMAHPHVYVGKLGRKAPKQLGVEVLKRRTLRLETPVPHEEARVIEQALHAMMGVKSVETEGKRVRVVYDLLQVTAAQLEAALGCAGERLERGFLADLRRSWVHSGEQNELSNLEVRVHKCCSGG